MNRTSLTRRLFATVAGLAIAFGGLAATATPASAAATGNHHHDYKVDVSGYAECDTSTGNWVVTWIVENEHPSKSADVTGVWAWPTEVTGLADEIDAKGSTKGEQIVPGTAHWAALKVELTWQKNEWRDKSDWGFDKVWLKGDCEQDRSAPSVDFSQSCDDITVTLTNNEGATKDAEFTVTGGAGFAESHTVAAGESVVVTVPATEGTVTVAEGGVDLETFTWEDSVECHPVEITFDTFCDGLLFSLNNPAEGAETTVVLTPTVGDAVTTTLAAGESAEVPFEIGEAGLSVAVTVDGVDAGTVDWAEPDGCGPVNAEYTFTCDELIIGLENSEDGSDAELVFTPSSGEPVTVNLAPGESSEDVVFPVGDDGLTVTVELNGEVVDEVVWAAPDDCGGDGGGLPVTGNTTMLVAGGAVALLALGGGLFLVARRHRVTFTA